MQPRKKKASAFVPRIVVTGIVLGVVPACALQACTAGTATRADQVKDAASEGSDQDVQFIALAQQGFDSGSDEDVQFIALAQQGFDAGLDGSDSGDG